TYQSHGGPLALRHEVALPGQDHPPAVACQASTVDGRLRKINGGAGLDGIDVQAGDAGGHGGGGTESTGPPSIAPWSAPFGEVPANAGCAPSGSPAPAG